MYWRTVSHSAAMSERNGYARFASDIVHVNVGVRVLV